MKSPHYTTRWSALLLPI
ncbi:hypothetical protein [Legionella hackeliae]